MRLVNFVELVTEAVQLSVERTQRLLDDEIKRRVVTHDEAIGRMVAAAVVTGFQVVLREIDK